MSRQFSTDGAGGARRVPFYKDLVLIQLAVLVFLIDQLTKFVVRAFLLFDESFPAEGLFRITHSYNTGSAFGMLQGQNTPLILVSFVGIAILLLVYRSQPRPTDLMRLSLGLQMGGAAGNLLDRLRLGHVTDFIDIGVWPVFNLADASIVTGLALLAWLFLRPGRAGHQGLTDEAVARVDGPAHPDGYSWCPICDGQMVPLSVGWRCSVCGVRETEDRPRVAPGLPAEHDTGSPGSPGVGPQRLKEEPDPSWVGRS